MRKTISIISFSKVSTLVFVSGLALFICFAETAAGAVAGRTENHRSLLVIYTTSDGEVNESVRLLDLALGHFADQIVFKSDESVADRDLSGVTHLVYYGETSKPLSQQSRQMIANFPGPLLVIGHNMEQLTGRFPFDRIPRYRWVNRVSKAAASDERLLDHEHRITEVWLKGGEPILHGFWGDQSVPLMVKRGDDAYFASADLQEPMIHLLGEGLHAFFQEQHPRRHLAYMRLEDVHPFSDPALVKAAGEYLVNRGIPFMIALIPVYTNPDTLEQYHLKDVPDLVEVLKDLQDRGASIILHGYTHQYRSTETGEGFEFWDVEHNTPISSPPDEEVSFLQRHDFLSREEYEAYRHELRQFDHLYTKTRIEQGIRELTELGLYPIGFEPPHYAMSQEGYRTVADYFTYLVGQVQLGDRDWRKISSAPYATRPNFLNGMTLLPETVGYYNPDSLTPLVDVEKKIHEMRIVQDGMIGMFYHPYLGIDHLQEMIALVEQVPNVTWIDLKHWEEEEKEKFAEVNCTNHSCAGEDSIHVAGQAVLAQILWIVTGVVSFTVTAFFLYTLQIRMGLRKQLFEERTIDG